MRDFDEIQAAKYIEAMGPAGILTLLHLQGKTGTASLERHKHAIRPRYVASVSSKDELDAASVLAGIAGGFRLSVGAGHNKLTIVDNMMMSLDEELDHLPPGHREYIPFDEDKQRAAMTTAFCAICRETKFYDWVTDQLVDHERVSAKAAKEAWERLKSNASYRMTNIRSVRLCCTPGVMVKSWLPAR